MNRTGRLVRGREVRAAKFFVRAAIVLTVVACSRSPKSDFERGLIYYKAQNFSQAASCFESALAKASPTAQAFNFLGVCQLQEGKTDEAIHSFQEALKLDPGYTAAHYNLALAQPEEAVSHLRQVVQSDNPPADAQYYLGVAYLRASAWAQAEQALSKYDSPDALNAVGVINTHQREYTKAKRLFEQCLTADPNFAPACLNLAVLEHHHLGQKQSALSHYQRYLELLPKNQPREDIRLTVIQLTQELAPKPKPKPVEVAAAPPPVKPPEPPKPVVAPEPVPTPAPEPVVTPPSPPQPQPTPAPPKLETKPVQVAEAEPAPTPPPPPPTPKKRVPITSRALKPGNHSTAISFFNEAVALQQKGKVTTAISVYAKAIAADPSYAQAYYNLAIAYRDARQPDRALDDCELALMASNQFTDARYNYAILLQEQGYLDDALAQYETLLRSNPNSASLHLTAATLCARDRATFDKARLHYQAYLKLTPNSPAAREIRRWLDQNR